MKQKIVFPKKVSFFALAIAQLLLTSTLAFANENPLPEQNTTFLLETKFEGMDKVFQDQITLEITKAQFDRVDFKTKLLKGTFTSPGLFEAKVDEISYRNYFTWTCGKMDVINFTLTIDEGSGPSSYTYNIHNNCGSAADPKEDSFYIGSISLNQKIIGRIKGRLL